MKRACTTRSHERSYNRADWGPKELRALENPQTAIPAIAQDARLMSLIDNAVRSMLPTHRLLLRDACSRDDLSPNSIHLGSTSPPCWTLKEYRDSDGQ